MFVRNLYKVTPLHMRLLPEDCDTVVLIHTACVRDVCGERRSRYTDNQQFCKSSTKHLGQSMLVPIK